MEEPEERDLLSAIVFRNGEASLLTSAEHTNGFESEGLHLTDTHEFKIKKGSGSSGSFLAPVVMADTPSSASDTGMAGQIAYDSDYLYVCVATDTWKRVAIATW